MICNRSIEGANKNITMNQICDRIDIGYTVYDMDPDTGELEVNSYSNFDWRSRTHRQLSPLLSPPSSDYRAHLS